MVSSAAARSPARERIDDRPVLSEHDRHVVDPREGQVAEAVHVELRVHDVRPDAGEAGVAGDVLVERLVGLVEAAVVGDRGERLLDGKLVPEALHEHHAVGTLHRPEHEPDLERLAEELRLLEIHEAERRDDAAALRVDVDQPDAGEAGEGLADRRPADAEGFRHGLLRDELVGLEAERQDLVEEHVIGAGGNRAAGALPGAPGGGADAPGDAGFDHRALTIPGA
jgi:hypothetical protein